MVNVKDILETINMIREENLDIRTITMGVSLYDCVSEDENRLCEKIYDKITKSAENLVTTGQDIEKQLKGKMLGSRLLLPQNVLRSGEEVFLDDYTVSGLEKALQVQINIVKSSGCDLIRCILGED